MTQSFRTASAASEEEITRLAVDAVASGSSALAFLLRGVDALAWIARQGVRFSRLRGFPGATITLKRVDPATPRDSHDRHVVAVVEIPTRAGARHLELRATVPADVAADAGARR